MVWNAVVDLHSKIVRQPPVQFSIFSCSFGEKWQKNRLVPPFGVGTPLGNFGSAPGIVFHTANSTPYCLWQFLPLLFFILYLTCHRTDHLVQQNQLKPHTALLVTNSVILKEESSCSTNIRYQRYHVVLSNL